MPASSVSEAAPIRLHGSLFQTRCTGCDDRTLDRHPVDAESEASLPRCKKCEALLRPDVAWFGEQLDPGILESAMEAAEAADVCLVVGTSGLVHPAASLPLLTRESGGVVVEVNTEPTPLTEVAVSSLRGPAGADSAKLARRQPEAVTAIRPERTRCPPHPGTGTEWSCSRLGAPGQ